MQNIWKTDKTRIVWKRLCDDIRSIRLPLVVLTIYGIVTQMIFGTVCPWAILTHFPCPACGLTRAGFCFITLHIREAMEWNAMICFWIPYLFYCLTERYVLGRKPRFMLGLAVGIALLTCIYFGIRIYRGTLPQNILPRRLYSFPTIW